MAVKRAFTIRFSDADYLSVSKKADSANVSISEYLSIISRTDCRQEIDTLRAETNAQLTEMKDMISTLININTQSRLNALFSRAYLITMTMHNRVPTVSEVRDTFVPMRETEGI